MSKEELNGGFFEAGPSLFHPIDFAERIENDDLQDAAASIVVPLLHHISLSHPDQEEERIANWRYNEIRSLAGGYGSSMYLLGSTSDMVGFDDVRLTEPIKIGEALRSIEFVQIDSALIVAFGREQEKVMLIYLPANTNAYGIYCKQ